MSENQIVNGSFLQPWAHHRTWVCQQGEVPYILDSGNAYIQDPWEFWWENANDLHLPEVTDAWKSHDSRRVVDGDKAIQLFKTDDQYHAGFYQQVKLSDERTITIFLASREKWGFRNNNSYWDKVELYENAGELVLSAYFHAWSNHNNEEAVPGHEDCVGKPYCSWGVGEADYYIFLDDAPEVTGKDAWNDAVVNVAFRVGIDMTGGTNPLADTVQWSPWKISYNFHHQITFGLQFEHKNWAPPRDGYDHQVTYLLSQKAGVEWRQAAAIVGAKTKTTFGHSADQAMQGPEHRKVYAINPHDWDTEDSDLWDFAEKYYKGVEIITVEAETPYEMALALLPDLDDDIALAQQDYKEDMGEHPGGGGIDTEGCYLTGKTIILRNVAGKAIEPPTLDKLFVMARSVYTNDNLLTGWKEAVELFPSLFSESKKDNVVRTAGELKQLLADGWEVILRRSDGNHFVYLEGVEGDTLHIIDTWDGVRKQKSASSYAGVRAAKVKDTEPSPPEPQYPNPGVLTSLHMQTGMGGYLDFLAKVKPSIVKLFEVEKVPEVKAASPNTKIIMRYYIGNNQPIDNPKQNAYDYVAQFVDSYARYENDIWCVESYNEMINSSDYDNNMRVVEFNWWFCEALHEALPGVVPGVFPTACGNPLEDWVPMLIPAVEQCVKYNGAVLYHGYMPMGTDVYDVDGQLHEYPPISYLESDARWYAHRWMWWDEVFRQHGLFPRYALTESGLLGVVKQMFQDGSYYLHMLPEDGWKSSECAQGNFGLYVQEIHKMNEMIRAWNAKHGNRCLGYVLFTSGADYTGWKNFQVRGAEYDRLEIELA